MKKNEYIRRVSALILALICFVLFAPQETQAASYTGQETYATLIDVGVGRYKLNYTGNTNHYWLEDTI